MLFLKWNPKDFISASLGRKKEILFWVSLIMESERFYLHQLRKRKEHIRWCVLLKWKSGSVLSFQPVSRLVFSALKGLTSVFGMGTGGTPSLLPPETVYHFFAPWLLHKSQQLFLLESFPTLLLTLALLLDQALDLLVSVSSMHYCTSTSDLSTSSSLRGLTSFEWEVLSWRRLHA